VLKRLSGEIFFMKNLSSYHPRSKKISRADKGVLKMAELLKNFCEKLLCLSSPFKKFSRAGKGCLKMAALRKISLKNLCPYHPTSKKLSRA